MLTTPSAARFESHLTSPLAGVSAEAWAPLVHALEVQPARAISESGGYGCYDLRPRRLVELGVAENLRYAKTDSGRYVHTCEFVAPWTVDRFLGNALAQYRVFCQSMARYYTDLQSGSIPHPEGVSVAGALVILHRGGRGALRGWPDLFVKTRDLYVAAQGAF